MFYMLPLAGFTALYFAIMHRNATAAIIAAILFGDALLPAGSVSHADILRLHKLCPLFMHNACHGSARSFPRSLLPQIICNLLEEKVRLIATLKTRIHSSGVSACENPHAVFACRYGRRFLIPAFLTPGGGISTSV